MPCRANATFVSAYIKAHAGGTDATFDANRCFDPALEADASAGFVPCAVVTLSPDLIAPSECSVCATDVVATMDACSSAAFAEKDACNATKNVPVGGFSPSALDTIPTCVWVPPAIAQPSSPAMDPPGVPDIRCAHPSTKGFLQCLYLGWSGLVHDLSHKQRSGWSSDDGNFIWWAFKRNSRLMYIVVSLCIVMLAFMAVVAVTLVVRSRALPDHYGEKSHGYAQA
jgi:hypothetical protein